MACHWLAAAGIRSGAQVTRLAREGPPLHLMVALRGIPSRAQVAQQERAGVARKAAPRPLKVAPRLPKAAPRPAVVRQVAVRELPVAPPQAEIPALGVEVAALEAAPTTTAPAPGAL